MTPLSVFTGCEREAGIIAYIPECHGGEFSSEVFDSTYRNNASMSDFINVFTEHAKSQPADKKIEMEEKAGSLPNWIHKNKKKFK